MDLEQKAIERIRLASDLSLKHYGKPLVCTYSGGKDSDVMLELFRRGGIPFEVHNSHTTADAPQTVRHIRKVFKSLEEKGIKCGIEMPKYKGEHITMWKLIPLKLMPPTRRVRYCCQVLKEAQNTNRYIATIIATPVENIVLYYVDPNESDFARAGLVYTVSGETNLIGFHTQGNYHTAVSEAFAIMGLTLFAEYIDAIAVGTINTTQTLGTLTVNSAVGSKSGDTKVTITPAKASAGNAYKYKVASSETTVDYGQNVKNWSAWDGESDITATTGQVITVVECDSTYKALSAGHATVTAN